ncbi:MAG: hypothetical protein AAF499_13595 [Pseudomonadota bacterium]
MGFRILTLIAILVAFVALCRYTYQTYAPAIQSAVLTQATSRLATVDGQGLKLVAVGRDLVLEGDIADQGLLASIEQMLASVPGVRSIDTRGVRIKTGLTEQPKNVFSSRILATRDGILLSGDAPSSSARAKAQALTGSSAVLAVNPAGDDAWIDLVVIISEHRRTFDLLEVDYTGNTATVIGKAGNSEAIRALRLDLAKVSNAAMTIVESLSITGAGG